MVMVGDAILAQASAEPAEPLHRWAYADWLEEQGLDGSGWRSLRPPRVLASGSGSGGGGGSGGGSDGDGGGGGGSGGGGGGSDGGGGGGGSSGGSDGGGGGGGSDDGGGGGGSSGGSDGGSDGGGGGSGSDGGAAAVSSEQEFVMPKVGDRVFLHAKGSYYPYAWCGDVVEVLLPNAYRLWPAFLLPHTRESGLPWAAVAAGDPLARATVRVRQHTRPVEVFDVAYCTEWVGDLPAGDQH